MSGRLAFSFPGPVVSVPVESPGPGAPSKMMRLALTAVLALAWLGAAAGQDSPFSLPQPMGGPIVGPDGRVRTGLDAHPVPSPWSGGIDVGLSGSQGNTDTLKLRAGLDLRYDDPDDF